MGLQVFELQVILYFKDTKMYTKNNTRKFSNLCKHCERPINCMINNKALSLNIWAIEYMSPCNK